MNSQELPTDRLATTDEAGRRVFLHPADVAGKYRTRRNILNAVLIVFFLVLPWIQINGHQALWIDIGRRRFSVFGLLFWAHDAPMLAFVLGGAAITLAFVTAVWGRIWCGWACPQTVFIDGVFRKIERFIEGDNIARRKLDEQPMDPEKFFKRVVKWTAFLAVSLIITHSFMAYFVGTEALLKMTRSSPSQNTGDFILMVVMTGIILFDFGWFREQFCTIMCPYGRFQSVLMDDRSQVVAYDARRGEPRRGLTQSSTHGDCVNCYRCVKVCPTGVDIRRGVQLECIACTACADACDEVMTRLKKPTGLIRYDSLANLLAEKPAGSETKQGISTRAVIYALILAGIFTGLFLTVRSRTNVSATFIRAIDTPYQVLTGANGAPEILNHFKLHLENQSFEDHQLRIELTPEQKAAGMSLVFSNHKEQLPAGAGQRSDVFIRFPKTYLHHGRGSLKIDIVATELSGKQTVTELHKEVTLVGPSG
jgi:cytochrome c oxidase accessory protein FixG